METETYKSGGVGARKEKGFKRWLQLKLGGGFKYLLISLLPGE